MATLPMTDSPATNGQGHSIVTNRQAASMDTNGQAESMITNGRQKTQHYRYHPYAERRSHSSFRRTSSPLPNIDIQHRRQSLLKDVTDRDAECTEDGRIGATEYAGWNGRGKGAEVRNEVRKKGRCGTYNVGVKDLNSAYVLCPRLAECGGLSIYGRDRGSRNNEGIVSRVVMQARRQIRTEY